MRTTARSARLIAFGLFLLLTLPVLTFISLSVNSLAAVLFVDTTVRAIPLLIAFGWDRLFLDGGELSPQLIPLWVGLTGLLLWPLFVYGVRPRIWLSSVWRKTIYTYAVVAVVCTVPAAWWLFTHTGYLF